MHIHLLALNLGHLFEGVPLAPVAQHSRVGAGVRARSTASILNLIDFPSTRAQTRTFRESAEEYPPSPARRNPANKQNSPKANPRSSEPKLSRHRTPVCDPSVPSRNSASLRKLPKAPRTIRVLLRAQKPGHGHPKFESYARKPFEAARDFRHEVLITDLVMPDIPGTEANTQICKMLPEVKVGTQQ